MINEDFLTRVCFDAINKVLARVAVTTPSQFILCVRRLHKHTTWFGLLSPIFFFFGSGRFWGFVGWLFHRCG